MEDGSNLLSNCCGIGMDGRGGGWVWNFFFPWRLLVVVDEAGRDVGCGVGVVLASYTETYLTWLL